MRCKRTSREASALDMLFECDVPETLDERDEEIGKLKDANSHLTADNIELRIEVRRQYLAQSRRVMTPFITFGVGALVGALVMWPLR